MTLYRQSAAIKDDIMALKELFDCDMSHWKHKFGSEALYQQWVTFQIKIEGLCRELRQAEKREYEQSITVDGLTALRTGKRRKIIS